MKALSYTAEYCHEDDIGFVTATSDYYAAAITIQELLAVSDPSRCFAAGSVVTWWSALFIAR